MPTIAQVTNLVDATTGAADWSNGWETCSANGFNVVIYTYNWGAVYSVDGGNTFQVIDANGLCEQYGKVLVGDQVVTYIPSINQFAWLILTTDQNMVLAMASPTEVQESGGTAWVTCFIPSANFGDGVSRFDRPTICATNDFLYIAIDLGSISIAIQLSIQQLVARETIHFSYFSAEGAFWLRATQNLGSTAYFAALTYVAAAGGQQYISNLRVFEVPDDVDEIAFFDVPIAAVPTENGTVTTPAGDWLANGRGSLQILGLTQSGNQLWAAWMGNRTVLNPPADGSTLSFPFPHIGIAVVDLDTRQLTSQHYVWSTEYAFAFPDLATNANGDIGLAFCWGGPNNNPQFGVGMLTGSDTTLTSITPGASVAAGGDYIVIRNCFPDVASFCAAGFNQVPPGPTNQPYYVLFSA